MSGGWASKKNRSSMYRRDVQETKHMQANWQAQCFYTFPKDPNSEVCKLTESTRAPCRNRSDTRGDRVHHPLYPSTGNLSSCFFYSGGVNFLMQLQFLAPVELFFKQLKDYSF